MIDVIKSIMTYNDTTRNHVNANPHCVCDVSKSTIFTTSVSTVHHIHDKNDL